MSISVMTTVWREFDGDAHTLLLALALADYADDHGGNIFPSVTAIAHKIRKDERTTRRQLRALEASGWLQRVGRAPGQYSSIEYRIDPAWLEERGHRAPSVRARDARPQRGQNAPSGGGSVPGLEGAPCPLQRGHQGGHGVHSEGAPVPPNPFRDPLIQETRVRTHGIPAAGVRSPEAEAKAELQRKRVEELGRLEVECVRAGFRTALPHENPNSYRTAFRLWQAEQRAKGGRDAATR